MGEKERYVPTDDDLKGGESRLTPTQSDLSKKWVKGAAQRERYKELNPRDNTTNRDTEKGGDGLTVTDQGHTIELRRYYTSGDASDPNEYGYQITIDGKLLNYKGDKEGMKMAERLWDKYSSEVERSAHGFDASEKEIKKARHEVAQEAIKGAVSPDDVTRAIAAELLSE